MKDAGAERFYAKRLAPNDNSKNQVYLGGGFEALNIIPHGDIETDISIRAGSIRRRDKAPVRFYWIDSQGLSAAPHAQLILYPKYPEVRMSGFLRDSPNAPNELMASRDEGRVLFLGVFPDGTVVGYVSDAASDVARELDSDGPYSPEGVFLNLTRLTLANKADPLETLLERLRTIHDRGSIPGQRLYSDGIIRPYSAQNGGGYTLEAELGIIPNGRAEPDFLGWEIKQFAVNNFADRKATSPVTLMTPEPTVGIYVDSFADFMRLYGYDDKKGRPNRRNFGGIYRCHGAQHADTGVRMVMQGYNSRRGIIDDMEGFVALVDGRDQIAAGWTFKDLLNHWNRKHAQAAYVPSVAHGNPRGYHYGREIKLGRGTDFLRFVRMFDTGSVYLDPAPKIENGKIKKRNQFRVSHGNLGDLYVAFGPRDIFT